MIDINSLFFMFHFHCGPNFVIVIHVKCVLDFDVFRFEKQNVFQLKRTRVSRFPRNNLCLLSNLILIRCIAIQSSSSNKHHWSAQTHKLYVNQKYQAAIDLLSLFIIRWVIFQLDYRSNPFWFVEQFGNSSFDERLSILIYDGESIMMLLDCYHQLI